MNKTYLVEKNRGEDENELRRDAQFLKYGGSYFSWVDEKYATHFESEEEAKLVADSFDEVRFAGYTIGEN
jgi:hypothetical protein